MTLFNPDTMTTDEKVAQVQRLLKAKCKIYFLSLGISQPAHGPIIYNIHGTIRTNKNENVVMSRPAESFGEMLSKMIEDLQSLK